MKFLLDACMASRSLHDLLEGLGHDVLSCPDVDPQAADEALLALARDEGRVLLTEDKDFGELVFVRRLPHPCIVRFVEMSVAEQVAAMRQLLERHAGALGAGAIVVVTREKVRIRRTADGAGRSR